jgi:hypothetical protein
MLRSILRAACLLALLAGLAQPTPLTAQQASERPIGVNLNHIYDWSPQFVFVDAMKSSRDWLVNEVGSHDWQVEGITVPRRAVDGYPTHVPFEVDGRSYYVHTLMLRELETGYPAGTYTLLFEGTGRIRLGFDAEDGVYTRPGVPHPVEVTPSWEGVHLVVEASDPADPIRNIRFVMPGFADSYATQVFHPRLLERLAPYQVIRFMKPQAVENTSITDWADRTTPPHHTQSSARTGGIAVEYVVDLTNRLGKDAWVNIPPYATDAYVRQFVTYLRDHLHPDATVYLEYANETWNWIYNYHEFINAEGVRLGFGATDDGSNPYLAGLQYTVYRSAQVFAVVDEVWGTERDRVVTTISPLGGWPWTGEQMIAAISDPAINPDGVRFDAVAISAYFGGELADRLDAQGLLETISVEAALDSLEASLHQEMDVYMPAYRALAEDAGLDFIAYEGGQHFGGVITEVQGDAFSRLVREMQRHPRMEEIYCTFYNRWYSEGGGLFVDFVLAAEPSDFESFGILENILFDPQESPKWRAAQRCAFDATGTASPSEPTTDQVVLAAFPNPFVESTTLRITVPTAGRVQVAVYDLLGRLVSTPVDGTFDAGTHRMPLSIAEWPSGRYLVRLETEAGAQTRLVTRVR